MTTASRKSHVVVSSNFAPKWRSVNWLVFTAMFLGFSCGTLYAQGSGASGGASSGASSGQSGNAGNASSNGNSSNNNNGQKLSQNGNNDNNQPTRQNNTNPTQNVNGQPCTPVNSLEGAPAAAPLNGTTTTDERLTNPNNSAGVQVRGTTASGMPQVGNSQAPCPITTTTSTPIEAPSDEPVSIQRSNPYGLQSLHDLYTQIPPSGGKLRRFGSDTFIVGTGNTTELPMDLPVGPEYVLGPGDDLVVNMWGGLTQRVSMYIDRQGQITLPEAGTINLDGLTLGQAQTAIQKSLSQQFQGEHVEISLGRVRTVRVYVVGDVQRPGAYDISSLSTPLSALYAAGGPTSRGSLRILRQMRGGTLVRQVDLYDFLLHGVRSDKDRLLPGDTIVVPSAGPEVSVEGMVHRPAIYELNGETELSQILDLAGGPLITGNLKQINVERIVAHEKRTMISLNLPDDAAGVKKDMDAFKMQGGDDVVISQILPYNLQAVYLEGHVFKPGKYPYHDGMTINDLLHSYQDVMPEPANHAELIRLQPPDYRPETISLNLPDVLMGNDPIKLRPFDLVRVFSRYEIDAPTVSIQGEVLHPGIFPLSQGETVTDLIRMAGDFNRSAYRDLAGLSSYTIINGQRVLVNHSEVDLKQALAGDKTADMVLKPGDVLSIDQLAGWIDIGASIKVDGEVIHAGNYGIVPGEHLSSIIKRAGGFTNQAYPQAAVLDRVQVRKLATQARDLMITRVESTSTSFNSGTMAAADIQAKQQTIEMQKAEVLARLRDNPVSGRLVIDISNDVSKWENTPADIEVRPGDTIHIPKLPNFVSVNGLVYNTVAISFVPGKTAGWYLVKAGGVASGGDKKAIYVIRADGSVVAHEKNWVSNGVLDIHMRPGDTIIVPEKIVSGQGMQVWTTVITAAQAFATIALAAAAAGAL